MNPGMSTRVLFALVLLAGVLLSARPSTAGEPVVFPDIQRVLDAGVLRVAILATDAAPMIMTGPDGTLEGSEPDLARDIANKLGVEVEFVRTADTYDGVVDVVARKEADLGVSFLTGGVGRAQYVLFSQPYINQSGRLFYSRLRYAELLRSQNIDSLSELDDSVVSQLRIGVVEGSIYQTNIERDFPSWTLRTFDDLAQIMAAVRSGEIFAGLHGSLQVKYFMRSKPSTAVYVALEPDLRQPSDIRIAVRPDAPNLLRWVDIYLAYHVGFMEQDEVVERYLNRDEPE